MPTIAPAANPWVVDTGSPPIPQAATWLAAYTGAHGPPLRLSQAAPGNPPHPLLLEHLANAAASPDVAAYGPILGDLDLRERYAAHLSALYGVDIGPEQCAITAGCNLAFVTALMAIARAGDAILLPEPWYFNHDMTARMLGLDVRALPCAADHGFVPRVEDARRLLGDGRVRAIVLVSPNNPTGARTPPETIRAFAALAAEVGCWLILDETYRDFLASANERPHDVLAETGLAASVVQLYSFSKSYAVPGYRLGAITAPRRLMPDLSKVLDCIQICAPRVGQRALVWGLPALAAWREANRRDMADRGAAFEQVIAAANGWRIRSRGAYFAYVEHPFAGVPAAVVARSLAERRGLLALPGTYFGGRTQDHYLRFAFGNAPATEIAAIAPRLAPADLLQG